MNEAELRLAFESRRSALHALGDLVTETIQAELKRQLGSEGALVKFLQIPPKPRVKETDSFLEKALVRKQKNDPLNEITDQVGVRFVVLLLEDISRIGKIVEHGTWSWQKDRDHESERLANPDYFAYQSDHYVVKTKTSVTHQGTTIPLGLACEIQIRTILQHAYAEMAHSSDYKPSIRLPDEDTKRVKRSLAKGSALIETTDDVFKEIKDRLREYNESTDALLAKASELYKNITGEITSPATTLGMLITDKYRVQLKRVTPESLSEWIDARPWFGDALKKKRDESVFYRDSVVILLGKLVTDNETTVPKLWPIDSSYLEDFYSALGISTNGIF